MKRRIVLFIAVACTASIIIAVAPTNAVAPSCQSDTPLCYQPAADTLIQPIRTMTEPNIAVPSWLGVGQ